MAGSLEWPGWVRFGKDQQSALQALFEYGPRYAEVLHDLKLEFTAPSDPVQFKIVEELAGSATTDFGAPAAAPAYDSTPMDRSDLRDYQSLLQACWARFDLIVEQAEGKVLRKGPRGGGRDLEKLINHVIEADRAYLRRLAFKPSPADPENLDASLKLARTEIIAALDRAIESGLPEKGPRGGAIWTPRYFIRRVAYHLLDHAWEIEDRID
ncbi:MAG: hypothetical protein ABFS17_10650 [Chloroflexota bacterium]